MISVTDVRDLGEGPLPLGRQPPGPIKRAPLPAVGPTAQLARRRQRPLRKRKVETAKGAEAPKRTQQGCAEG